MTNNNKLFEFTLSVIGAATIGYYAGYATIDALHYLCEIITDIVIESQE